MSTDWTLLPKAGIGTWLAGQDDITAGQDTYFDLQVGAGQLGNDVVWENKQRS